MKHPSTERVLDWLGATDVEWELLETYARWLTTEGIPGGALGPSEAERLWQRHIDDALSFAAGFETPPGELWDIGSGAGLPGLPLAILFPETAVTLLDRSGRRCALLRRVTRMLQLPNVSVVQGAFEDVGPVEAVTMRAVLPPHQAAPTVQRLLRPGGVGVVGLARRSDPDPAWFRLGGKVVEVPVLDPPGWLLIMQDRGTKKTSGDGGSHESEGRSR